MEESNFKEFIVKELALLEGPLAAIRGSAVCEETSVEGECIGRSNHGHGKHGAKPGQVPSHPQKTMGSGVVGRATTHQLPA